MLRKLFISVAVCAVMALSGCAVNGSGSAERRVQTDVSVSKTEQTNQVETVSMPNLVGATEGEVKTWLSRNGFKFNTIANYGLNPRMSLCVGGKGLVTGQSVRPGAQVKNQFSTSVRIDVDCEWR
jgi:beta-lactam-binding protein with PASTA domain